MARKGDVIWKGHHVRWEFKMFRGKRDLSFHPHFELTAKHKDTGEEVTCNNVQLKSPALRSIDDLAKLPVRERDSILNQIIAILVKEPPFDK